MPSSRRLRPTPEAEADLASLLQYSAETWGEQRMASYAALLLSVLRDLAEFPGLGRQRDELRPGLRSYPAGQHIVFYRVSGDELIVRRIIHSRRDVDQEPGL